MSKNSKSSVKSDSSTLEIKSKVRFPRAFRILRSSDFLGNQRRLTASEPFISDDRKEFY